MRAVPALLLVILTLGGCAHSSPEDSLHPLHPVEIIVDRYGIPHIRGDTPEDVAFAQGYVQAELRPAQIEGFRLLSQGRRSEVFGPSELDRDILIRALNFYGFAQEHYGEFRALYPEIAANFRAFVRGINRKYEEYRNTGWPPTLALYLQRGYTPEPWKEEEIYGIALLLAFGLSGISEVKVLASLGVFLIGPKKFQDIVRYAPATTAAAAKEFYELQGIQPAEFRGALHPQAEENISLALSHQELDPRTVKTTIEKLRELFRLLTFRGSNCFGISGRFTETGAGYLASDTHQGLDTPGPYLIMHLVQGSWQNPSASVIGSSFPAAPGIVFGHNGTVAWAPTNGFADIGDFYLERFSRENPEAVLRRDGSIVKTRLRRERFRFYDQGKIQEKFVLIRHIPGWGPILPLEVMGVPFPFPISLRWTGFTLPGPSATIYRFMQAKRIEDLFEAQRSFYGPSLGFCFADTTGRVAYSYWTQIPVREKNPAFSPLFLIPAVLGPLWSGFLPMKVVPFLMDPPKGYVWAANGDPVGNTFDNDPLNDPYYYGFMYDVGFRGLRLDTLLKEKVNQRGVTVGTVQEIQLDRTSLLRERVVPYLELAARNRPDLLTEELREAMEALRTWNGDTSGDRFEPAIFYTFWMIFLHDMLLDDFLVFEEPDFQIFTRSALYWLDRTRDLMPTIEAGTIPFPSLSGENFFDNRNTSIRETRDELLLKALQKTLDHLHSLFPDRSFREIRWEELLRLRLDHDLVSLAPQWNKATREWGLFGGLDTVSVGDFSVYRGSQLNSRYILDNAPSNRYIWELAPSGIRSWFMLASGESELPDSPHFMDLPEDYVTLKYHPFPYEYGEIMAVKEASVILK